MKTSQQGLDLIKRFEGFSPVPYLCPAKIWTIGYGHAMRIEDVPKFNGGISKQVAEAILRVDVLVAERAVARLIRQPLNQNQFDALVSFTFNLGTGALQRSSLRQAINRGEMSVVPAQLMRWVWGGGRKLPGLIKRRAAEGSLFAAGDVDRQSQ